MDELAHTTAGDLARLIRERKLSSRELLELYLARIERRNAELNAVVTLDVERARRRAQQLDDQLARGQLAGPLHGLALTIKDAFETEGIRTTCGAPELAAHVPARNAVAVQRLIDAGAVVFGKTNTPAHAADVQSYNELFGVTNNPHDVARSPGGSSGGAAAAVAAGFTAFELGGDIGGSIRTPAHWSGVFGHKTSWGVIPQRGAIPGPPGSLSEADLSVIGPLARSASDLQLALDVLAGPDAAQAKAWSLALPPPRRERLSDYRIAVWLDDADCPVDDEVHAVLERSVDALRAAGAQVDLDARPDQLPLAETIETYQRLLRPIIMSGMPQRVRDQLTVLADAPESPGHVDEALLGFARHAMARHVDWLRAHERRERYRARLAEFFQRFDVLLCPVNPVAAIRHEHEGNQLTRTITVNGRARPYMDLLGWISLATLAHLPASVAPVGRTAGGLPVGIQIVGPHLEDRTTIDVARRIAELMGGYTPPLGW